MARKPSAKPAKGSSETNGGQDTTPRNVLPIPDVTRPALTTFDARDPDTKYSPIRQIRPPQGAPNVLVVLIDDAGFGSSSAFGGPCHTPAFEKLAANGLKYTRFHTTGLCSPTRAALLSGRNHHSVGMGAITEFATSAPGQNSSKPNTCAALAETLKLNGYSTAQFGKCHEVPVWESSAIGPFDHWPTGGGGFQYFYGFIGGETHQYYPNLFEGTTRVEPRKTPDRVFEKTGRWALLRGSANDPNATVYQLDFDRPDTQRDFLKVGDDELRLLDRRQHEIPSPAPHSLYRVAQQATDAVKTLTL